MLASNRIIFAIDDIDSAMGERIMREILEKDEYYEKPLHILISSVGGEMDTCFALFDLLQLTKSKVYTYAIGSAYSAAFMLFMAGEKRYVAENSTLLIHRPILPSNDLYKSPADYMSIGEYGVNKQKKIVDIIHTRSKGVTKETAEKMVSNEDFITPNDAIMYGIATGYITKPIFHNLVMSYEED